MKNVCLSAAVVAVLGLVWSQMFAADGHSGHMAAAKEKVHADKEKAHAGHKAHATTLKHALEAIETARKAVQANDKTKALAALTKAKVMVTKSHHAMVRAEGIVNARCPLMGSKLDPAKVPAKLTRIYKGQSVGFCCGGCPSAWDKLSEAKKEQKLRKSISAAAKPVGLAT